MYSDMKITQTIMAVLALFLLQACSEPDGIAPRADDVVRVSGETMGSMYHISWTGGEKQPGEVYEVVEQRLAHLISVFSTYEPTSELSIINKQSSQLAGQWLTVSADLMSVLQDAEQVNRYSIGRMDVTVGPLVNLWGFGAQHHDQVPEAEAINEAMATVGMRHLELKPETNQIRMDQPLYIDLSSVAKGWAVDDIGLLLEAMGISDYLVEIGGEVRVRGKKPTGDWRIAIERPVMEVGQSVQKIIAPGDMAVATSGDYRNYFEKEGRRYSHTIDPQTGYPINHTLASVTVVMPTCSLADAWATALNVAGPEAGMALAEANDLAVYMIIRDGEGFRTEASSSFTRLFESE